MLQLSIDFPEIIPPHPRKGTTLYYWCNDCESILKKDGKSRIDGLTRCYCDSKKTRMYLH